MKLGRASIISAFSGMAGIQICPDSMGLHIPSDALDSRLRGNDVWTIGPLPVIPP